MVSTIKFSQFSNVNPTLTNFTVGYTSGNNFKSSWPITWTSSTRPSSPPNGFSGYNTTLNAWEFWNGTIWTQFSANAGGTVVDGLQNNIGYYAANGNTISPLSNLSDAILVTNSGGVPSLSTTLPSGLNIPGYANEPVNTNITSMTGLTGYLQAPLGFKDSSGNIVMGFSFADSPTCYLGVQNGAGVVSLYLDGSATNAELNILSKGTAPIVFYNNISGMPGVILTLRGDITNPVNYLVLSPAATGSPPAIYPQGSDSVIGLTLLTKNSNFNLIDITATIAPSLQFYNAAATHYTAFKAATSQSTDATFVLPAADGTASAPIITDGSGNLSFLPGAWVDFSGGIALTGFSGSPTITLAVGKIIGKTFFFNLQVTGTSNATTFTVTGMPYTCGNTAYIPIAYAQDNSSYTQCNATIAASGTTLTMQKGGGSSSWTNSGTKTAYITGFYETT